MPTTVAPDALLATVTALRAALTGRAESYAQGVTVGTVVPTDRSADLPRLPYVAVRLDGMSADRRRTDPRADVRVLVWASDEEAGYSLARLCEALLLAFPGDARVRAFAPLTGPLPTSDPETDLPLSVFTVEAALRPQTLS